MMARRVLLGLCLPLLLASLACGGGGGGGSASAGVAGGGGSAPVQTGSVLVRVPVAEGAQARGTATGVGALLYSEGLTSAYGVNLQPLEAGSANQTVRIENVPFGTYRLVAQSVNALGQPVGEFSGPVQVRAATQEVQVTLAPDPTFGGNSLEGADQPGPPFRTARIHPVAPGAGPLTSADFDGDGRPDVVMAGTTSSLNGCLNFLKGLPGGAFAEPAILALDPYPTALASADFDADGRVDLACAAGHTQIAFLRGRGDGTFDAPVFRDLGQELVGVAAGRIDDDDRPDLLLLGRRSGPVTELVALRGQGDGTFMDPVRTALPAHDSFDAGRLAVGDLNGDGRLDAASAGSYSGLLHLLVATGDGGFRLAQSARALAYGSRGCTLGDFDGDGRLDAAVGSDTGNNEFPLVVLYGRGDGTVEAPKSFSLPSNPLPLLARDFDRDGREDLLVSTEDRGIYLLPGAPGRTLGTPRPYRLGGPFAYAAAADVDGDLAPDALLADRGEALTTLRTGLSGGFELPRLFRIRDADQVGDVAVGDLDGDGRDDVAGMTVSAWPIFTMRSRGDGTFLAAELYSGNAHSARLLDLDRDGNLDFTSESVLLGAGDGTLRTPALVGASSWWGSLRSGDFDGDGRVDLLGFNSATMALSLGLGDGTFRNGGRADLPGAGRDITAGDFDGDGALDAAAVTDGGVYRAAGAGDGSLAAPQQVIPAPPGGALTAMEAADFDRDGRSDLAVTLNPPDTAPLGARTRVLTWRSLGTSFQALQELPVSDSSNRLRAADVDGDGDQDLLVVNRYGKSLSLLRSRGDGTFDVEHVPVGCFIVSVATGDVNGDGKLDLVSLGDALSVVLGR